MLKQDSTILFNEEAEKAVISSIFYNEDALDKALFILGPSDFYKKENQIIFECMIKLSQRKENIDPVTITQEFLKSEINSSLNIQDYIETIAKFVPTDKTVESYSKIVKEQSIRRSLLLCSREILDQSNNSTMDISAVVENAQKNILAIDLNTSHKIHLASNITHKVFSEIWDRTTKLDRSYKGIETGFKDLDTLIGGFKNSDFILIGARPSIGKTAFALNIAANISLKSKKNVGFFSLEMTAESLMYRIFSFIAKIDSYKLRNNILSTKDLQKLRDFAGEISSANLYIDDTPNINLLELRTQCRKMKKYFNVDIIFIDYVTLITLESRNSPRHEQVATISRSLKELARELEIPIVALSQLTRDTEGKEPNLASLRESGSLEQDADIVILLHREKNVKRDDNNKTLPIDTKIIIAKHRNGPTDTVEALYIPHYTEFVNKESNYN